MYRPAPEPSCDVRPLIVLGAGLLSAGVAAVGLALWGRFLPHDERYLGMTADDLCALHGCRVVHFMAHDRAAFGGVVAAIGVFYLYLAAGPIRRGEAWAWRTLALSGAVGFLSFLAYVGYGYLDGWHLAATLALLPCYLIGLWRARPFEPRPAPDGRGMGRTLTAFVGLMATAAGALITGIGMTSVFVPEDLAYMDVEADELRALNPRLVPLIAHDRAGFGGAMASAGMAAFGCAWFGRPSSRLRLTLALAGLAAFGPAIGVHFAIGYTDPWHLLPAVAGAAVYGLGLALIAFEERRRDP